jgi:hypothetical protein
MGLLRAEVEGLAVAAALAAMGCTTPDSSALFRPAEAAPIRTETPRIAAPPDNPPGDIENGLVDAGGISAPPTAASPVGNDRDAEPLEEPPIPSTPAVVDAGPPSIPLTPDAGTPDAGSEPPPPPPPVEPECGGALFDGICWYLGELDEACDSVCAAHGGFEPSSTAWIGTPTQGGSLETCATILELLGEAASVTEGFREDELGFGCHLFLDEAGTASAWWLTAPAFSPAVSNPSARLACGCAN